MPNVYLRRPPCERAFPTRDYGIIAGTPEAGLSTVVFAPLRRRRRPEREQLCNVAALASASRERNSLIPRADNRHLYQFGDRAICTNSQGGLG